MKTLRYSFFGTNPKNMQDCLDYLQKQEDKRASVSVSLKKEERITENYTAQHLFCLYSWIFNNGVNVVYGKSYGGFLENQRVTSQLRLIEKAKQKVKLDLERLTQLGITLEKKGVWTS